MVLNFTKMGSGGHAPFGGNLPSLANDYLPTKFQVFASSVPRGIPAN